MRRLGWAAGVAVCGLGVVGIVTGCVLYAIPDRPVARNWPECALLLMVPYFLAAVACWLSPTARLVRVAGTLVCLAGVLMAGVAVSDAWPTFFGGPAPSMPASALVVGIVLMVQYPAGLIAVAVGFARRKSST
jgi:hypothetical protein